MRFNDFVQIIETVTASPGQWGRVIACKRGNITQPVEGWTFMGSLVKV
jgi:hypothetical protein